MQWEYCHLGSIRFERHMLMTIRLFLMAAILFVTSTVRAATPNIIFIMADDIGYECYGCYGSEQYSTPNIDRMASRGMKFEHCYSQPLCTPSRVKVMTGLSNVRNYSAFSVLNRDQRTFGHMLKKAGYTTFVGGKWQLLGAEHYGKRFRGKGSLPGAMGFDRWCLWQVDKLGDRYWNPLLNVDGENRQFGRDDYGPDIVNQHVLQFMEEHRDGPFLVYYPMIMVHNPFLPTPASESRKSKNQQKNFEDMVNYMDRMVGKVVQKTEELGIADNTLILFTGDNGTNKKITSTLKGRTIQGGKGMTTDAGTRVALVACQPGTVPAGRVCSDLVDFSDFLPTFREVAGLPPAEGLDGHSFAPQLRGETGNPREWMFCYYNPRPERTKPVRFARDQRWKLYADGRFYDVSKDPLEKNSLDVDNDARRKLSKAIQSMPSEGATLLTFPEGPKP